MYYNTAFSVVSRHHKRLVLHLSQRLLVWLLVRWTWDPIPFMVSMWSCSEHKLTTGPHASQIRCRLMLTAGPYASHIRCRLVLTAGPHASHIRCRFMLTAGPYASHIRCRLMLTAGPHASHIRCRLMLTTGPHASRIRCRLMLTAGPYASHIMVWVELTRCQWIHVKWGLVSILHIWSKYSYFGHKNQSHKYITCEYHDHSIVLVLSLQGCTNKHCMIDQKPDLIPLDWLN